MNTLRSFAKWVATAFGDGFFVLDNHLTIMLLVVTLASVGYAAPGDLDTTFGTGGVVTVSGGAGGNNSIALLNDGKIVVAGAYGLWRFNANGAPDTTFNGTGYVQPFPYIESLSAAVQGDHKIIMAGRANVGADNKMFGVARFNSDGTPDTSFNGSGQVTTDFYNGYDGYNTDSGNCIALQSDGKIIVAGYTWINITNDNMGFAVARYNANGTPDTTFNGSGKVTTDFGFTGNNLADAVGTGLAVQGDGKIVVVGSMYLGLPLGNWAFAVARYNTDGTPDTTFNGTGKVTTRFSDENVWWNRNKAYSVAIQQDGKIVVAGESSATRYQNLMLVRYNPNGSLDTSFNGTGKVDAYFSGLRACSELWVCK